ncbi:hypothetical protein HKD21_13770 [Gluconobacter cerevisiae]|uniref:Glycosyltransferase n=1 Tax=Gluconobacter cerevisiae TaxID=1379734 RepID=A0ABR9YIG9_9PROT|nr:hypothetical protein [Gluconobacter cerevisiae]MBF0877895.1 hypothetical protein [Gluconobacter cerevisiae]
MPLLTDMFDACWYLETYPDVRDAGIDPLEHYMTVGWREGRNPSPAFDTQFYLHANPDVVKADLNPLEHFVGTGQAEGRGPLSHVATAAVSSTAASSLARSLSTTQAEQLKALFDEDYYRSRYPGSVWSDEDAFAHFMTVGWHCGYNPSEAFDTQFYLDSNPDVGSAELNPLEHYVMSGRAEGRPAAPNEMAHEISVAPDKRDLHEEMLLSGMEVVAEDFDVRFYRRRNPDIKGTDDDLFRHFMTIGWKEGRDPSGRFDVAYYLWANPDVAAAEINPLLHYRLHSATEIRRRLQPHAMERAVLRRCQAVQDRKPFWELQASDKAVDEWYLTSFLAQDRKNYGRKTGLIVSISHDDYRNVPGGVQNCVRDEAAAFASHGWAYLHLFPARALSTLAPLHIGEFVVSLNDQRIGRVTVDTLLKVLAVQKGHYAHRNLIIHHLLGVMPECVPVIAQEMQAEKSLFWLHDFFTICPSYALMRNDIAFCDAPAPTSPACGICAYGEERQTHLPRIKAMFEALRPEVIAPSHYTLAFWQKKTNLAVSKASVQEHAFITDQVTLDTIVSQPLKIGFVGTPVFYKGWDIYRKLAAHFLNDSRYEFFYLGSTAQDEVNITSLHATVTHDDRNAMQTCIRDNRIDVIVNWSLYPETFCFTAYEALAAGTFLIAPKGSGNVEDLLKSSRQKIGHVAADETELMSLFEKGKVKSLLENSRRTAGTLVIRPCTYAYLVPEYAQ